MCNFIILVICNIIVHVYHKCYTYRKYMVMLFQIEINLVTQILLKMKVCKVPHILYLIFNSFSVSLCLRMTIQTYIILSFLPDLEFQHPERFFQQRGPFFYLQNNPNFPVHWNSDITWIYTCVNVVRDCTYCCNWCGETH